jgi:hypothetical protein
MAREADWNRFRWLTSGFLNACYSCLEILALRAYFSFWDDDGEPIPDSNALDKLSQYVVVFPPNRRGRVHTGGTHPLVRTLYDIQKKTTHHQPLAVRSKTTSDPEEFRFEDGTRDGNPVLQFSRSLLDLLREASAK